MPIKLERACGVRKISVEEVAERKGEKNPIVSAIHPIKANFKENRSFIFLRALDAPLLALLGCRA